MTVLRYIRHIHREISSDLLEDHPFNIYLDATWLYMVGMLSVGIASMAISTTAMYGMTLVSQSLYPISVTFLVIAGVGAMGACVGLGFLTVILCGYAICQMLIVPLTLSILVLRLVQRKKDEFR